MTQMHIDLKAPTRPHNPVWSFGGGVSQVRLLLRKDVRRHLMICRDELGFRHVACRGILGDRQDVALPDGPFSFDEIEPALDWLLENGMVPFLRLSRSAAGADGAGIWLERATALATRVDGRYGCDAREWYFEIDGADSAGGAGGTTSGGDFATFDAIARAIRQVHPEYRIGWRAAGGADALEKFLTHVAAPPEGNPPGAAQCDFVTLEGSGDVRPADARQKLSAALGEATPLIVIGWPGPAPVPGPTAFMYDDCARAAFVARTAVDLSQTCQGIFNNIVSDIDAETQVGAPYEPFHGGQGLITVNDVRKSAFHALRLLNEHAGYHGERLEMHWTDAPAGLGCVATRSEHTLRLLFWLHREPGAPATPGPVRFTIEGVPASVTEAQIEVIRPGAGSAFEAWSQLDKPQFINRDVLDALELASLPAQANVDFREYPPRLEPGMVMQLTMNLPFDEVS